MSTPREFLHTETPSHSSSFLRNEGVAALRVHARLSLRSGSVGRPPERPAGKDPSVSPLALSYHTTGIRVCCHEFESHTSDAHGGVRPQSRPVLIAATCGTHNALLTPAAQWKQLAGRHRCVYTLPYVHTTGVPSHRDSFTLLVFFEERGRRGASRARAPFSSLWECWPAPREAGRQRSFR